MCFVFNVTATTETNTYLHTLSLHDALPNYNGIATWASDLTARPLPLREYTSRDDYNVLIGINRHTITPNGWTHEQFNTKVLRKPDGSQVELAREFGLNDYQKVDDIDFQDRKRVV